MAISNNALAGLMVIAILVVLIGVVMTTEILYSRLGISITGMAPTAQGTATVRVEQSVDIATSNSTDFGTLRPPSSSNTHWITLNTTMEGRSCPYAFADPGTIRWAVPASANGCDSGTAGTDVLLDGTAYTWATGFGNPIHIFNRGGDAVTVNITASANAATWLGAATAGISYNATQVNGCTGMLGVNTPLTTTESPFCNTLGTGNTNRTMSNFGVRIPADISRSPALKTVTITFTACADATDTC